MGSKAISHSAAFTVRCVTDDVMPDLDVRVVGITEATDDPNARCFLFQRSLSEPSYDDLVQGMGTYAISNESGMSAYGALDSYWLTPELLGLNFTAEAASLLGVAAQALLDLELSDEDFERLSEGLRAVVGEPSAGVR